MAAAHPWRPLVHGGYSSVAAARPWQQLVHGGRWSMAAALKENSSYGSCNENHVINNYSCTGSNILLRSILHSVIKHFAFYHRVFRTAFQ